MQENNSQITLTEQLLVTTPGISQTKYQAASLFTIRTRPKPQYFLGRMGHFHSWKQEHMPDEVFQGREWQFIVDHHYTFEEFFKGTIDFHFEQLKLALMYDNIHSECIYWMRHGTVLLRPVPTYKKFLTADGRQHTFIAGISIYDKSGKRKKHLNFDTKELINHASHNRKFWEEHQ